MRFIIVTGLSGAGKSEATNALEDMGYFCVDNLPPKLIKKFAEVCKQSKGSIDKVALVMDIRGGIFFDDLFESLSELSKEQFQYERATSRSVKVPFTFVFIKVSGPKIERST